MATRKLLSRHQQVADPTAVLEAATKQYVDNLLAGKQPVDSDLTTIAGLTATTDSFMQAKAGAWASRTIAQVKADLINAELTALGNIAPANNDIIQRISGAWTNRTMAQLKTSLAIVTQDITKTGAVVYQSVTQTLANAVLTPITHTSEISDTLGWHSNVTNTSRITPTVPGLYKVTAVLALDFPDSNGDNLVTIYLNGAGVVGAPYIGSRPTLGAVAGSIAEGFVRCNGTTDYIEMVGYQSRGATKNTYYVAGASPVHSMLTVEWWAA